MNLEKILLIFSVLLAALIVYFKSPPHSPEIFVFVFLIVAAALTSAIWRKREQIILINRIKKLISAGVLLGVFVSSFLFYDNEYENHIHKFETENGSAYIYMPILDNDRPKKLRKHLKELGEEGSLKRVVLENGAGRVKLDIDENVKLKAYLISDAYFMGIAIICFTAYFLILLLIYLKAWESNVFGKNKDLAVLRQNILELISEDKLDLALTKLDESSLLTDLKLKNTIVSLLAQNRDIEHKFSLSLISHQEYIQQKSRLRWALLNVIS